MSKYDNPYESPAPLGYDPPGYYPNHTPPPVSGMAIGGLVTGILSIVAGVMGFFCCCMGVNFIAGAGAVLLGVAGAVLGYMGMQECTKNGKSGYGMGMAGMVTGIIGALLGAISVAIWIGFYAFALSVQPPN
jgi:hypothetical protein